MMIVGKIARILSDDEVVLNLGSQDGVEEDMEFVIFVEGQHIFDPETRDDLGPIETVKGRVKVYHVMERLSRARTLTYQVGTHHLLEWVPAVRGETRRRKLKVQEGQESPLSEDLTVRVGDKVRSV